MLELLDINDVAGIYRVPVRTLYEWRERGYGPRAARIGKKLMYRKPDVERFVEDAFAASK
jgi:hypothetical protein